MGSVTDELYELIAEPVINDEQKKVNLDKISFLLTTSANAKQLGLKRLVVNFDSTKAMKISNITGLATDENLLSVAIRMRKIEVVKLLIQSGMDRNEPKLGTTTPLSLAAHVGEIAIITYLLEIGANINKYEPTKASWNPLVMACKHGDYEVMKILLLNNADMSYKYFADSTEKRAADFLPKDNVKADHLLKAAQRLKIAIDLLDENVVTAKKALYTALELDQDFVLSYIIKIAHTTNLRGQGLQHNEEYYHPHLLRLFVKNTKADIKTFAGFIEETFSKERFKELLDELNAYELNSQHFNENEMLFKTPEEKTKTLKCLEKGTQFEQIKAKMKDYSLADKLKVSSSPIFSANASTSEDQQPKGSVVEKMENNFN
jgi:hypothetical protein